MKKSLNPKIKFQLKAFNKAGNFSKFYERANVNLAKFLKS